jgi:lysozyme
MSNGIVVVDMSHYQPNPIDWNALLAGGVIGVIHKATEGSSYVDDTLFERAGAAMRAGLKWSTYHFMRPGNIGAQMDHYLRTVDPVVGERMCLDHEDAGVSLSDLKEAVSYLLDDERKLQVTIYSGHVIKEQLGDNYDEFLAANTSLWIAHYTTASQPNWPKSTWPQWTLWQFTDQAHVAGIDGNVDGDRFNGSNEQCLVWFGPAGSEPAPEPEVPEVNITTTGDVKITVNGQVVGGGSDTA